MTGKRVLVVAAHPDDEVLGSWHAMNGDNVSVLFMADGVTSRMVWMGLVQKMPMIDTTLQWWFVKSWLLKILVFLVYLKIQWKGVRLESPEKPPR